MHANLVYLVKRRLMPYVQTQRFIRHETNGVCAVKNKDNINFYEQHVRYHNIICAYKKNHTFK